MSNKGRSGLITDLNDSRFRALIENSFDAVALSDASGKILYVSPSIKNILGFNSNELVGKNAFLLIHPEERFTLEELHKRMLKDPNKIFTLQYKVKSKDGSYKWVEVVRTNMLNSPSVGAIVVNIRDITERKELERRKDEFISAASHELKTPITTLKGYLQILNKHLEFCKDDRHTLYISSMEEQVDRLANLVEDLLDVSKIEAGKLIIKKERFDLDLLIKQIADQMKILNPDYQIVLKLKTKQKVKADKYRIGQVISNLLSNALKFSPKNKKIIVRSRFNTKFVIVKVQDFGIGISKKNLGRVFERFFQASTRVRPSFSGLGLGLNICFEIIKQHKGLIWVKSEKGKGSTVSFKLPI